MSCNILRRLFNTNISNTLISYTSRRRIKTQCITHAAAAKKAAPTGTKKHILEVETDSRILCTRLCGGNINKEGEDPVLKADEEYPDWLWELRTEKTPIPLEEMSEDDPAYWRRLKLLTIRQNNAKKYVEKL